MMAGNSAFTLPAGQVHIAFSGGRTSAFMLHKILQQNGPLPDRVKVVFANTGREDERTLDFVHELSRRWAVDVQWVEYVPHSPFFAEVDHAGASRAGEPFEAMIRHKRFIPHGAKRICTEQLKVRAARRMLVALGWKKWTKALGIRADEPQRHDQKPQPRETIWMPLVQAQITRPQVLDFWRAQPFNLPEDVVSNCRLCFQFGLQILQEQMIERPDDLWPERMEELGFGTFFNGHSWSDIRAAYVQGKSLPRRRGKRVCGAATNEECFA